MVAATREVLPTLEELGIGFVPFSPWARAFSPASSPSARSSTAPTFAIVPRFTPEARKANQTLVDLLGEIAAHKQATRAQIAIAWLLAPKTAKCEIWLCWQSPASPFPVQIPCYQGNLQGISTEMSPSGDLRS